MKVYLQSIDDSQAAMSPKPFPAWLMTHENWNPRDTLAVCSNLTGDSAIATYITLERKALEVC